MWTNGQNTQTKPTLPSGDEGTLFQNELKILQVFWGIFEQGYLMNYVEYWEPIIL